ncbi:MAG: DUF1460 domain-containing protein [Deltaproteobacteria bacterium]|nr:DUF1460 domain-containing protein [Deltaproteobacteria bacterium]
MDEIVKLGHLDIFTLENVMRMEYVTQAERIVRLSEIFVGIPYKANTLSFKSSCEEVLVINFEGLDCMTLIEYTEALRLSSSFDEFKDALKRVRYRNGIVSYSERKHFFTDWIYWNEGLLELTRYLKEGALKYVKKNLNVKNDGTLILPGIEPQKRELAYLPTEMIDDQILKKLSSGCYVGFYTSNDGLDCSHAGILVRKKGQLYLRHASSLKGKVLDEDFLSYVLQKEGIMVLGPG